jgi:hypothetical protein
MAQRAHALGAELRLATIQQLQRIAQILLDLADCARDEVINPPPRVSDVSPIPLTRITGFLAALRAAAASLSALDGPELPSVGRVAEEGYRVGVSSMHFVGEAFTGLQEVEAAIDAVARQ